jgi:hypothetical protein
LKLEVLGFEIGNRESEIGKREIENDKGGMSELGKTCDISQKLRLFAKGSQFFLKNLRRLGSSVAETVANVH